VLALAGCGAETQTVATASISSDEFDQRAEAICARGRLRGLRYEPAEDQPEREALANGIETILLPALGEVVDEIYELGAPAGERRQTETFLVELRGGIDNSEELDAPTLERVEELLEPSAAIARKQGLSACAFG
jgi:hypothetical protein